MATVLLTADPNQKKGVNPMQSESKTGASGKSKDYNYMNNEDSVLENRNKMRLNAASQAIALGQHAVALATESGKDVDALRKEIEDPLAMEILTNKNKDYDLVVVECVKNKLKVKLKSSKTDSKEKESVAVKGTSGRKLEL